ncbi:reverse transcriptase [Senna tora]|uniref:Reverse transcriptase n=1 Tax=Senna tora TaxID=362788 RepID=A0A834W8L8_9FABA|nr:reverse transcriptase [Senna tora]
MPAFDALSPIQDDPSLAEIEEVWKEILAAQEENTTNGSNFEIRDSSNARANDNTQTEEGLRESMKGGTITFLPPRVQLTQEGLEGNEGSHILPAIALQEDGPLTQECEKNEGLQLDMQMAWNCSSLVVIEPNPEETQHITQREDSPGQHNYLIITRDDDEAANAPQHIGSELIVLTGQGSSHSEGSNSTQRHDQQKKGKIGPVTFTLTLKAPQKRKRKPVFIEEIDENQDTNAKKLKVHTGETNAEQDTTTPGPEIAQVAKMLEACFMGFGELKGIVHPAWHQQGTGSMAVQVQDKIQNVSKHLSQWHKENFRNLNHQISQVYQQVEKLQNSLPCQSGSNEELIARKKLEFLLKSEEIKWDQRAKQLWSIFST